MAKPPKSNWQTYLAWELGTAVHASSDAKFTHTQRLRKTWLARPDREAYVHAIRLIDSWHASAKFWQRRAAHDLRTERHAWIPQHRRNQYRALGVELHHLRKLAKQQETKDDLTGRNFTDARSRQHTIYCIHLATQELRTLEPLIPAEDIARRLFPNLDDTDLFPARLRSHIVESCSKLQDGSKANDRDNNSDRIAAGEEEEQEEEELVRELQSTIQIYRRSRGEIFAHVPLAQDIARRSRRLGYRREKTLPCRGLERTWSKPSGPGGRVPLNAKERKALFEAELTPPPSPDRTGIVKLYRWWRGRRGRARMSGGDTESARP